MRAAYVVASSELACRYRISQDAPMPSTLHGKLGSHALHRTYQSDVRRPHSPFRLITKGVRETDDQERKEDNQDNFASGV